jgi:predicted ATPase
MIASFRVIGLWNRQNYVFDQNTIHEDLNIFTGSNGSGKTTILKLMWYMLSGHIRQAFAEVEFSEAELISTTGKVKLKKRKSTHGNKNPRDKSPIPVGTIVVDVDIKSSMNVNVFVLLSIPFDEIYYFLNEEAPSSSTNSWIFPTFRRIEGGYSFGEKNETITIIERFKDFSKRMSHKTHQMKAFADFDDVKALINEISSDIAAKLRPYEDGFTQFLSGLTNNNGRVVNTSELDSRLRELEQKREEYRKPLSLLSKYVDDFLLNKSIKVTDDLILGRNRNQIRIDQLSGGEKNFLSFIVYAMSVQNGIMFIDEPELTLHIDWQRALLPILREVAPNIQFFIATHAATIYSNFPDKDIWLDTQINQNETVL